jgi:hypothetical protein
MSEWNDKHEGLARQDGEQGVDRELDMVLAKYASIEPRAGLEQRVLANLRAERQPVLKLWSWRRTAVAAVLLAIMAAVLSWRSGRPGPSTIAQRPPRTASSIPQSEQVSASAGAEENGSRPSTVFDRPAVRRAQPAVVVSAAAAVQHKLDQFPSPRPLSEQEQILVNYVAKYPETAALIAQARTEEREKEREEEAGADATGEVR